MTDKKKKIPNFKNEAEEFEFWSTHDVTEYFDWSKAERTIFPNLKPSTTTISVRLPDIMIENLKFLANREDIPYQSLLKRFLAEMIRKELYKACA